MKKIYLLLTALIIFVSFSNAQNADLNGVWKLTTSTEYGDQTFTRSTLITFKDKGVIEVSSQDLGTWSINESDNSLIIDCFHFQEIDGENKIESLDEKELKLINPKGETTILKRMDLPEGQELNNKFTGEWLLENVEKDGKTEFVGMIVKLSSNGIFYTQGFMFGKWDYNKAAKKIIFDVKEEKDPFNGEHTILKSNKATFILDVDGSKLYFSKIDYEQIAKENDVSSLIGTWRLSDDSNPNAVFILKFNAPDTFVCVEKAENSQSRSTSNGMWIFNKSEKTVILMGYLEKLSGLNKVIAVTNNEISLENNGSIYLFKKEAQKVENNTIEENTKKVEHITFSYDDFYTEYNDGKYANDKEKLPWLNWREMKKDLLNVNQLVYSYDFNDTDNAVFENKVLTTDVIANLEDEGFIIEDIFKGYDNSGNPEQGPNTDYNNPLYPLNEYYYRVAGNEQIITPAGTFDCTVIEIANSYDLKKKLWMINDKVGVYAKIIDENTSEDSGYYHIYELQDIK